MGEIRTFADPELNVRFGLDFRAAPCPPAHIGRIDAPLWLDLWTLDSVHHLDLRGRIARRSQAQGAVFPADHLVRATGAISGTGETSHLRAYASVSEARTAIRRYLSFYNQRRPHSLLAGRTPDQAYFNLPKPIPVAA